MPHTVETVLETPRYSVAGHPASLDLLIPAQYTIAIAEDFTLSELDEAGQSIPADARCSSVQEIGGYLFFDFVVAA